MTGVGRLYGIHGQGADGVGKILVINGHLDAFGMGSAVTVYSRALSYRESPPMVESDHTWLDKIF
jgi:hypothetical protein